MAQLTFAQTTFCTIADVKGKFSNPEIPLVLSPSNPNLDATISSKIADSKDQYLRQPLILECQKRFQTDLDSWRTFKRSQIEQKLEDAERQYRLADRAGRYPLGGFIGYDGQFFDIDDLYSATKPGTLYTSSAPVNGTTYANSAETGDVLFDLATNLGYINRGTKASPTWQRFIADDGIDFIQNPSELKWAAIWAVGILMAQEGMFRSRMNYQDRENLDFQDYSIKFCKREYQEALLGMRDEENRNIRLNKGALELIRWNISGSGTLTAYEIGVSNDEVVIF